MKKVILLISFLVGWLGAGAQVRYEMSILTCGPGSEVYSVFGHTGLRVRTVGNEAVVSDVVYNFGLFDFDNPGFVVKFVRGDLDYFVDTQPTTGFVDSYFYEGRGVVEQPLNINPEQAALIMEWLSWRIKPANRAYKYKFLARNCTTEVRDLLFEYTYVTGYDLDEPSGLTFRQHLDECLAGAPWLRLGIDLVLGSRVDREMTRRESMFLPDKFMRETERVGNGNSPLVVATGQVPGAVYHYPMQSTALQRMLPSLLLGLVLLLSFFVRRKGLAAAIFVVMGILGTVLMWMSLYSLHEEMGANFNLLWCNPIWFLCAWACLGNRPKMMRYLAWICDALITAAAVVALSGLQRFTFEFWMIWAILIVLVWREKRSLAPADPLVTI